MTRLHLPAGFAALIAAQRLRLLMRESALRSLRFACIDPLRVAVAHRRATLIESLESADDDR